ncbi:hypothetical protein [Anaeromyxobacter sp. PSR-1]|uniref:hypothetical protein n=1 Tax=Anaeromyxobacter sp. PSR-1 TaxID=1300915 RepID=UPI001364D9DD|nr:hypothetical protein [Anaeromyxobacter sp. PSR-1]
MKDDRGEVMRSKSAAAAEAEAEAEGLTAVTTERTRTTMAGLSVWPACVVFETNLRSIAALLFDFNASAVSGGAWHTSKTRTSWLARS